MKTALAELSVLIADDSITQQQYAQQLCTELGLVTIYTETNGVKALKVLQENVIDVVLVDLEMPVMDGVELIHAIAHHKLSTNVIILSAKDPILISSVGTMAEAEGLTVLGTFKKPLHLDLLQCSLLQFIVGLQTQRTQLTADHLKDAPTVTGVELNHAITHGEMILAYQPKLTVQGLLLRGVEALARWQHPQKGLISPTIFIPLAERLGLINALTHHLLAMALNEKRNWQHMGLRFHIAFNLSPISLADEGLVDWIIALTQKYDVLPQEITFEITENALLNELACAIRTLARLRLKGFNIAIDDYGTGFANAQQLSRVPATELKLDRSLVHNVSTRPQQRTILASSIDLAKNLKMITVAEGVETLEDYKVLLELGADQVQGFYFSKPLYPNDLLEFVKTGLSKIRATIR
ncbi:MAG: EAL domain-containing response regulator [Pseudomonadota bacterium]